MVYPSKSTRTDISRLSKSVNQCASFWKNIWFSFVLYFIYIYIYIFGVRFPQAWGQQRSIRPDPRSVTDNWHTFFRHLDSIPFLALFFQALGSLSDPVCGPFWLVFPYFLHPNFEHVFCLLDCVFYIDFGTLNLQNSTFYYICRKPLFFKQT